MAKSPFVHPKGSTSIIKSILKSSLPRSQSSNPKKHRVSISSKKNQTSSSDEHDGGTSNQRRSSVNFASTPSFQIAPDDFSTPEDTPGVCAKLSFVTNASSFTPGDKTFTPGSYDSPSSTISSLASNTRLSTDTSTFNDSQEVTITSAKRRQLDEDQVDGVRRSKRTKVPALQYWKNERIKYERRRSGWFVNGIESVPTPKVQKRKMRNTNKKRAVNMAKKSVYDGYGGDDPQTFDDVPEDLENVTCEPVSVVNPYDGEEVKLDLFHTPEMLHFVNTSQQTVKPDDPLIIDKYISHSLFGIGQLVLRPGAEKGTQHVRKDTMVFHVLTGQVEATVHETTTLLRAGSTFFVPEGNCYNLKNTHKTDTRLFFVQIKATEKN